MAKHRGGGTRKGKQFSKKKIPKKNILSTKYKQIKSDTEYTKDKTIFGK